MSRSASTSIQRQLQLFFVGLLVFTVLLMGSAWFVYNQSLLQEEAGRVLTAESDIIGTAAKPALMFNDARLATEVLRSMKFDSDISLVKLFTYDGKVLSTYSRNGAEAELATRIPFRSAPGTRKIDGRLGIYRLVEHKGSPVGVIYLESHLQHLQQLQQDSIVVMMLSMLGCLVTGWFVAARLRKRIASPITELASLMEQMGTTGDYALRMEGEAFNRETEELFDGFNQMTEQIQTNFDTIEAQQEDLRRREERFRNIVELAPLPVLISRQSDGQVMFANRPAADLLKVGQQEIARFKSTDFYRDPAERSGLMATLAEQGQLRSVELNVVRRDGVSRVISLSMNAMPFEGEQALCSAFFDITEQKEAERKLAQHNQLLEVQVRERTAELQAARDELLSTLDNMMDTYYKILPDGKVGWTSASIVALLGYQMSEIAGMSLKELCINKHEYSRIAAELARNGGVLVNQTIQLRHKLGHTVWVSFSAHWVLGAHGKLVAVEGVARDITAMVEAENHKAELERRMVHVQRLESLGVLAGGIAHDFNNILAGILANAELAELNLLDGSSAEGELKGIIASSIRAAELCQQMLAYSGQGSFRREDLSVTELVEEALQLIDISIPKNISLNLDLASGLPAIHADRTQLQQVIMNLVTNAAESIGHGCAGSITIRTVAMHASRKDLQSRFIEAELEPGDYVLLEVSDSGCGMDGATIEKMFEPFFTTKFTGRGLGMSAVLGIVRSHGGTIHVSSRPGRGTMFRILLPVCERPSLKSAEKRPTALKRVHPTGYKVLVVEDEEAVSSVVKRLLERMGCEVMIATDGESGVETYRRHRDVIDLVLMDLTMPVMDGREALKRLREIDPDLPVFICSGYSYEGVESGFAEVRPSGFLQKPFTMQTLQRILVGLGEGEG